MTFAIATSPAPFIVSNLDVHGRRYLHVRCKLFTNCVNIVCDWCRYHLSNLFWMLCSIGTFDVCTGKSKQSFISSALPRLPISTSNTKVLFLNGIKQPCVSSIGASKRGRFCRCLCNQCRLLSTNARISFWVIRSGARARIPWGVISKDKLFLRLRFRWTSNSSTCSVCSYNGIL